MASLPLVRVRQRRSFCENNGFRENAAVCTRGGNRFGFSECRDTEKSAFREIAIKPLPISAPVSP